MSHQVNLFNAALLPARVWLTARHMALGWLLAAGAAMAVYGWQSVQGVRLASEASARAGRLHTLQSEVQALGVRLSALAPSPLLERELRDRRALLGAREAVLQALQGGGFADTGGHARYLRAFARQWLSGIWLTALSVRGAGQDIRLEGRTLDPALVPDYLRRLGGEAVLKGHAFNRLEMRRPAAPDAPAERSADPPRFLEFTVASEAQDGDDGRRVR